ncbi:MAG: MBL fold metallo-hydrolase [Burkholderiales bacterium]|nr:MBL fold metallo-hydrolase [Burkholderiales bacterium]
MRLLPLIVSCVVAAFPPTQALAFEGIRITLLGTGMAESPAPQGGPGMVIESGDEVLLFDCGRGSLERLERAGLHAFDVTAVFLTSLDSDHVDGCREIWRAALRGNRFQGFSVWGPSGTVQLFRRIDDELALAGGVGTRAFDIADNIVYQPESLTVTAFVARGPTEIRRFGYRVDAQRRSVALSSDAGAAENIARYARGVQVMMQEVSGREESEASTEARPSPEEAGRLFRASRPYLALYSHVIAEGATEEQLLRRTRRSYRGAVQVGRDLMVIEVQNEVQIRSAPSEPRMN